jgi:hypothetical protein
VGDSLTAVVHFDENFIADTEAHRAGGIIIKLAPNEFVVAGEGFHVSFAETKGTPRNAEYLTIEEGTVDGDRWVRARSQWRRRKHYVAYAPASHPHGSPESTLVNSYGVSRGLLSVQRLSGSLANNFRPQVEMC